MKRTQTNPCKRSYSTHDHNSSNGLPDYGNPNDADGNPNDGLSNDDNSSMAASESPAPDECAPPAPTVPEMDISDLDLAYLVPKDPDDEYHWVLLILNAELNNNDLVMCVIVNGQISNSI